MRLQNSWPLSRLWGFYSCGSLVSCSYWMTAHFSKDWTPYPWDYSPHAFSLFFLRTLFFLFRELIPSVFDVIKPHSMKVMTPSGERPWPRDYTPTLSLFFFFFSKSFFCSRQPCELLICPVLDDIKRTLHAVRDFHETTYSRFLCLKCITRNNSEQTAFLGCSSNQSWMDTTTSTSHH